MISVSEAEACRWLGRRVSLIAHGAPAATGRLRHVSSRCAFLLQEDASVEPFGGIICAVPLAHIIEIVPVESEGFRT
ncbi:MAG TPA: hypothetical protein VGD01_19485 [Candidatus Elarobacter sp.]|jgi:hypothetical protein